MILFGSYARGDWVEDKAAYVDVRYKPSYVITETELDKLADQVNHLKNLCEKLCQEKIASFAT